MEEGKTKGCGVDIEVPTGPGMYKIALKKRFSRTPMLGNRTVAWSLAGRHAGAHQGTAGVG